MIPHGEESHQRLAQQEWTLDKSFPDCNQRIRVNGNGVCDRLTAFRESAVFNGRHTISNTDDNTLYQSAIAKHSSLNVEYAKF